MYEFMTNTVIMAAFVMIICLDIFGIGYWTVTLVKWVKKKLGKAKGDVKEAETE